MMCDSYYTLHPKIRYSSSLSRLTRRLCASSTQHLNSTAISYLSDFMALIESWIFQSSGSHLEFRIGRSCKPWNAVQNFAEDTSTYWSHICTTRAPYQSGISKATSIYHTLRYLHRISSHTLVCKRTTPKNITMLDAPL